MCKNVFPFVNIKKTGVNRVWKPKFYKPFIIIKFIL